MFHVQMGVSVDFINSTYFTLDRLCCEKPAFIHCVCHFSTQHSHSAPANIHYTYELTQTELSLVWEQPVEVSDSGLYECVASNSQGESRASVHLTVIRKHTVCFASLQEGTGDGSYLC